MKIAKGVICVLDFSLPFAECDLTPLKHKRRGCEKGLVPKVWQVGCLPTNKQTVLWGSIYSLELNLNLSASCQRLSSLLFFKSKNNINKTGEVTVIRIMVI